MRLTRRQILIAAAAAAAGGAATRAVSAATLEMGGARLDVVSDGHLVLPGSLVFAPTPPGTAREMEAEFGIDADRLEPPCNLALLRTGGRAILFDAGAGEGFMPSAGRLPGALAAIGVAPEEITEVILTHAHPDHLWGILDDFDDPAFPEARVLIGRAEHAYWSDPGTVESIGAERQAFAVGAARRLGAVGDVLETFEDGDEVAPGVTARITPGHTPGHMSFEIAAEGGAATLLGDAVANHHVAFRHPGLPSGADQDMEEAARTREALLADLAARGVPVVGFHLPGGLGRVLPDQGAYAWAPAP